MQLRAPSAVLTAISRRRARALERSTFATFAQAMRSTSGRRGEQGDEGGSNLDWHQRGGVANNADARIFVGIRKFPFQASRYGGHFGLDLIRSDTGLQTAEHRQVAIAAPRCCLIDDLRHPQVWFQGNRRTRRCHTDDAVPTAIQNELSAENVWIGAEARAPQFVAQHRDSMLPQTLLILREPAAGMKRSAEHRGK